MLNIRRHTVNREVTSKEILMTFYDILAEEIKNQQKFKYGKEGIVPDWFIKDFIEQIAKDLVNRYEEIEGS